MKNRDVAGPEPSEEFLAALRGGGGVFIDCGNCGREHYAIESPHMADNWKDPEWDDEKFRASLIERAKTDKNVVLHYGCDSVYYYDFDNYLIPDGCPCNGLRRYENFMWAHRGIFKNYMNNMAQKLERELETVKGFVVPKGTYE